MPDVTPQDTSVPTPPTKKSTIPKILGFGCGGLILFCIIGYFIMTKIGGNLLEQAERDEAAMQKAVEKEPDPDKAHRRLGVTRSWMMRSFPGARWTKGPDTNGMENYSGVSENGGEIHLLGPDSNLAGASHAVAFGGDQKQIDAGYNDISTFIRAIDGRARNWAWSRFKQIAPHSEERDSMNVGNRIYRSFLSNSGEGTVVTIGVRSR